MIASLVKMWDNSIDIKIPPWFCKNLGGVVPLHLLRNTGALYMSIADNDANKLSYSTARDNGYILTSKTRTEVLYKYKGRCYVCGIEEWRHKLALHMHRVIPGKLGGLYELDNLICCCRTCHRQVEGKSWQELEALQHPSTTEGAV
jgi:hypothetical protein